MNYERSIPFLMGQTATSFKVYFDKRMKEINLHGGQIFILLSLWEQEGQTQIQISKELNLSPPTVHKMIKSLIDGDFVYSRQCLEDSRQSRVFLTQKGINIKKEVQQKWEEIETDLLFDFSETEKLILIQLFDKLSKNLQSYHH